MRKRQQHKARALTALLHVPRAPDPPAHERAARRLPATDHAGRGGALHDFVQGRFYAALLLALPVLRWQVWGFIAPALEQGTQRALAGLVASAGVLLAAGVAFGYLALF